VNQVTSTLKTLSIFALFGVMLLVTYEYLDQRNQKRKNLSSSGIQTVSNTTQDKKETTVQIKPNITQSIETTEQKNNSFQEEFITIGTGGVTGVYYPTGGALCRLVNKDKKIHGVRCSVESSGGSVFNINAIREGEMELGVAQSDWQYHAYRGTSKFSDQGAYEDLRAVMSIYPESLTIVARADANINTFEDLKGKRVNVGNAGSGTRATMDTILTAKGWTLADFKEATELKSIDQGRALCDNQIDAMVAVVGHPSGMIKEATGSCDTVIVSVTGPAISQLISDNSYYRTATIPAGLYSGNTDEVTTFGVGATIVTSKNASEKAIYQLVKSVVENIEEMRKLHPAFANLKVSEMAKDSLSAPLHSGAMIAFKEAGIL